MQDFRSLRVWQKAHQLVLDTYRLTNDFADDERYGLTSQMRRAAVSIPSNIAEGCGRSTGADFARFLQVAAGSSSELQYQMFLAAELGYVPRERHAEFEAAVSEVKRMLSALMRRGRENSSASSKRSCDRKSDS